MSGAMWVALGALVVGTFGFRLAGVVLGRRLESHWLGDVTVLLVIGLLAALAATQAVYVQGDLALDARLLGVSVAVALAVRGHSLVTIFLGGVAVTAVARALTALLT